MAISKKETCLVCFGVGKVPIPGKEYEWAECGGCGGKGYTFEPEPEIEVSQPKSVGEIKPLLGKSGVSNSDHETMVVTFGDFDGDALERINREFQPRNILILSKKLSFNENNDFWFIIETVKKFEDERNVVVVSDDKDFLEFIISTSLELLDTAAGFFTGVTYNFTDGVEEYNSREGIYKNRC